jgi:hypothetical protein
VKVEEPGSKASIKKGNAAAKKGREAKRKADKADATVIVAKEGEGDGEMRCAVW